VVFFGLFQGLAVLPVLLSLIGPDSKTSIENVENGETLNQNVLDGETLNENVLDGKPLKENVENGETLFEDVEIGIAKMKSMENLEEPRNEG
jgi:hypothetical protein